MHTSLRQLGRPRQPPGADPDAAYGAQPGGSGGSSGFATASLLFGLLGGVLLSAIFGIIALSRIRKRGQTGRGQAIAGLALSGCWLLVIVIGATFAILSDAGDDYPNVAHGNAEPTISVTDLKPGYCVNGIQTTSDMADLPIVSCAEPHEAEAYAVSTLPDGAWPRSHDRAEAGREARPPPSSCSICTHCGSPGHSTAE